jgi:hypothetical protein
MVVRLRKKNCTRHATFNQDAHGGEGVVLGVKRRVGEGSRTRRRPGVKRIP